MRSGFARCCLVNSYDWRRFPIIDLKKRRTFTLFPSFLVALFPSIRCALCFLHCVACERYNADPKRRDHRPGRVLVLTLHIHHARISSILSRAALLQSRFKRTSQCVCSSLGAICQSRTSRLPSSQHASATQMTSFFLFVAFSSVFSHQA